MPETAELKGRPVEYRVSPEELIDITMPLSDTTPTWPEDTQFSMETRSFYGFRTSRLTMSSHAGTHMDSPAHLADGRVFINDIPVSRLILPAVVVDCCGYREIDSRMIDDLSLQGKALILKTDCPKHTEPPKWSDYAYLSQEAAEFAARNGVKILGIDTLSVDPPDSASAHEILLNAGVPILENLLLEAVLPGNYLLICFPLNMPGADGSPVRAFVQPY